MRAAAQARQEGWPFWGGVAAWALLSAGLAFLGGIRWDENFAWGLIIRREAWYPEGHPQFVFVRNAPTVLTYGMAALMELDMGPAFLNFHRNILCLFATTAPVFALAYAVGRRVWPAHAAVLLVLAGACVEFGGSYPQFIWPTWFSNGHIGLGYALFCLALLLQGRLCPAYFLTGLLLIVHPAQAPIVGGTAAAQMAGRLAGGRSWRDFKAPFAWALAGVGVSVVFILLIKLFWAVDPAQSGPYAPLSDPTPVLMRHLAVDMHRQWPKSGVFLAAGLVMLLAFGRLMRRTAREQAALCLVYAGLILGWTFAAGAAVAWGPDWAALLLLKAMPYRLLNHLPPLAAALGAGMLARKGAARPWGHVMLAMALVYIAAVGVGGGLIPAQLWPYAAPSAGLVFFLAGTAAAWESMGLPRGKRRILLGAGVLAVLLAAPFHQFGAAMLAAGLAAGLGLSCLPAAGAGWTRLVIPIAAVPVLALHAWGQWSQHEVLSRNPAHIRVRAVLDAAARQGLQPFLLNIPGLDFEFIARTRCGLMNDFTLETSSVQYMPVIAGGVECMRQELYTDWEQAWPRWTSRQWEAKARRFGFSHVWSPIEIPTLTEIFKTDTHRLYRAVE